MLHHRSTPIVGVGGTLQGDCTPQGRGRQWGACVLPIFLYPDVLVLDEIGMTVSVSISSFRPTHPARGGTDHHKSHADESLNFNPPTPRGVGRTFVSIWLSTMIFQSTHPARGGTKTPRRRPCNLRYFNPPTPRGVGHLPTDNERMGQGISIHPPREGWDLHVWRKTVTTTEISIHPPREGWDAALFPYVQPFVDFNPPTPRGVGHQRYTRRCCTYLFQSTHPARGGTRAA